MRIGNAFPAIRLQSVDQGRLIGDAKCLTVSSMIVVHVTELDVGVEAAAQVHEVIAVLYCSRRFGNQHADTRIGLRQHQSLHDFDELRVVVNSRLEIVCEDRDAS